VDKVSILVALAGAVLLSGCMEQLPWCTRGSHLGHPTMTPEDISSGIDGHVRAASEGSANTHPQSR